MILSWLCSYCLFGSICSVNIYKVLCLCVTDHNFVRPRNHGQHSMMIAVDLLAIPMPAEKYVCINLLQYTHTIYISIPGTYRCVYIHTTHMCNIYTTDSTDVPLFHFFIHGICHTQHNRSKKVLNLEWRLSFATKRSSFLLVLQKQPSSSPKKPKHFS